MLPLPSFRTALILLGSAVAGLALLFGALPDITNSRHLGGTGIDIGVEHTMPFMLMLSVGRGKSVRYIEMGTTAEETVAMSLPASWMRREVRYVPLAALHADPPMFGFVRWQFPPHAVVSFRTQQAWDTLTIHNPSSVPFEIRMTNVDLHTQRVERDTFLMKDHPIVIR